MSTTAIRYTVASAPMMSRPATTRAQSLVDDFGGLARRLLRSVSDLTVSDRQFLRDFQRGRSPMTPLNHFIDIAARAPLLSHQFGASEIVRAHTISRRRHAPSLCVSEAGNDEDQANSALDIALRAFERNPTPATLAAAKDAGEQQLATTRTVLDALYAVDPRSL